MGYGRPGIHPFKNVLTKLILWMLYAPLSVYHICRQTSICNEPDIESVIINDAKIPAQIAQLLFDSFPDQFHGLLSVLGKLLYFWQAFSR